MRLSVEEGAFVKTVSIISFYFTCMTAIRLTAVNRNVIRKWFSSRDIWIVFSISGNYAYIPLSIQANMSWQSKLIRNGFLKIKRFLQLRITTKSAHSIYNHFTLLNAIPSCTYLSVYLTWLNYIGQCIGWTQTEFLKDSKSSNSEKIL